MPIIVELPQDARQGLVAARPELTARLAAELRVLQAVTVGRAAKEDFLLQQVGSGVIDSIARKQHWLCRKDCVFRDRGSAHSSRCTFFEER